MKNQDKKSKQHVQLPNDMTKGKELAPKDLLIYVCIKKHQNKDTKTCFPSLETIMKLSSSSKPTVLKAIDNLKRLGYIQVTKDGRKNVYSFNPYKNFEPFSTDFLEKEDLSANEKAYLIATQQYMFKDIEGFGIGLSYVKRVCEWHKWKVEAKNNPNKGITISIQINKNDYE